MTPNSDFYHKFVTSISASLGIFIHIRSDMGGHFIASHQEFTGDKEVGLRWPYRKRVLPLPVWTQCSI